MTSGNMAGGTHKAVAKRESVDAETRGRIAAWLNYKMRRNRLTIAATAELMGVSAAAVSRVSSGARTPGLDFVLAMSRALIIPLDVLVTTMPPVLVDDGTRDLTPDRRRQS